MDALRKYFLADLNASLTTIEVEKILTHYLDDSTFRITLSYDGASAPTNVAGPDLSLYSSEEIISIPFTVFNNYSGKNITDIKSIIVRNIKNKDEIGSCGLLIEDKYPVVFNFKTNTWN